MELTGVFKWTLHRDEWKTAYKGASVLIQMINGEAGEHLYQVTITRPEGEIWKTSLRSLEDALQVAVQTLLKANRPPAQRWLEAALDWEDYPSIVQAAQEDPEVTEVCYERHPGGGSRPRLIVRFNNDSRLVWDEENGELTVQHWCIPCFRYRDILHKPNHHGSVAPQAAQVVRV